MSEERRLAVLRAIVQDYVQTSEPVGSRSLLERHQLGVSAATVRNDMAALEEEGLIAAPHTSAGRVPTDAGYRLFVDRLSSVKPMSAAERSAIAAFLAGRCRPRRRRGAHGPAARVADPPGRGHAVPVADPVVGAARRARAHGRPAAHGRAHRQHRPGRAARHRHHRCPRRPRPHRPEGERVLDRIRAQVNALAVGRRLVDAAATLEALPEQFEPSARDLVRQIVGALDDALVEEREERVVLAGTANLARFGTDFPLTIGPVLEALEEHVVLLKLLSTARETSDAVSVRIGHENPFAGLQTTSVVSTEYGTGADLVAGLGVLGPTRMDYPTTMASVRAVATYVSRILAP